MYDLSRIIGPSPSLSYKGGVETLNGGTGGIGGSGLFFLIGASANLIGASANDSIR